MDTSVKLNDFVAMQGQVSAAKVNGSDYKNEAFYGFMQQTAQTQKQVVIILPQNQNLKKTLLQKILQKKIVLIQKKMLQSQTNNKEKKQTAKM